MREAPAALLVGRTLGHYRILDCLGRGGMGEVYKAHDIRLKRTVAVKVLPPSFGADPERVRRFRTEARVASSFNHPHIAAVYDVGEEDGCHFIAMEYVEGESLGAWLARAPRGIRDVLLVMEQVGEALAKAHEVGILHRDVKPNNVVVSTDGYAKLLDFGLAKIGGEIPSEKGTGVQGPLTTRPGAVFGTMAYMSPEQARGQELDRRSDVFSFGIVLFEVVAGAPPFTGDSGVEAVGGVLRDDPIPRLSERPEIPRDLVRVLRKSLDKDPARRYQFMDDLVVDLRAVRRLVESGVADRREPARLPRRTWIWTAAGLLFGAGAGLLLFSHGTPSVAAEPRLSRAGLLMRPLTFDRSRHRSPAISPDGELVSYASDAHGSFDLMVQQIATGRPLRITTDPGEELEPAFSPDGQTLAFATQDGRVQTVPSLGGVLRTLADGGADAPVWSPDGQALAYRRGTALFVVNRTGGAPRQVTDGAEFPALDRCAWSPDGRWLVFPSHAGGHAVMARVESDAGRGAVLGGAHQVLWRPHWSADGKWLFGVRGFSADAASEIWAAAAGGERTSLGEQVRVLGGVLGYRGPSVSRAQGKIVFEVEDVRMELARLSLTASGVEEPIRLPVTARLREASVSPSGHALAVVADVGGRVVVCRMDKAGSNIEPLHDGPAIDRHLAWSPDAGRIAFTHTRDGESRIAVVAETGGPLRLVSPLGVQADRAAWSPDARRVAYTVSAGVGSSVRAVGVDGGPEQTLARSSGEVVGLSWSRDGRWIAAATRAPNGSASVALVPSGGGESRLTLPRASAPLFLGDGRLVFTREDRPGVSDLWSVRMSADGAIAGRTETRLTRLPAGESLDPRLGASTDGRFLYFPLRILVTDHVWLGELPQPQ